MRSWLKSRASRIVFGVFAVAIAWICFQVGAHRHTGILRTLAGARQFLSRPQSSPDLKPPGGRASPGRQHSVNLSWKASPSAVVGYNVYRRGVTGVTKINLAPVIGTTYVDRSVEPGQTYYYVTRAVNSDKTESSPSNEVRVVVPSP
jgi:hypothetical protein